MSVLRPRRKRRILLCISTLLAPALLLHPAVHFGARGADRHPPPFIKHVIDADTKAESCAVADINQDGHLDVISGEKWYEAPHWKPHLFRAIPVMSNYVDDMGALALDVNRDGYPDVVSGSWFRKMIAWYENPGNRERVWTEHVIETGLNIEIISLVDMAGGSGRVLPNYGGSQEVAWFELTHAEDGRPEWSRHRVSPKANAHGIGVGDVNGDGRVDILTPKGWLEAPEKYPTLLDWKFHSVWRLGGQFGETGQIYAYDVNGDGKNDLIASAGHSYGVFWYEQRVDKDGFIGWVTHIIDNTWSQAHAVTLADLDGDGLQDIVTGKRYRAHDNDPGTFEPVGLYWYQLQQKGGKVYWVKHTLSYDDGVGTGLQIVVEDLNRDGRLDIIVPGKTGLHWMEQTQ